MSKFSKLGVRRTVGAIGVAAIASLGLASLGSGNAAAGPLPNGSKTTVGVDGATVKISRTGERAYPVPSVSANGAGRSAEVSGTVTANLSDGEGTLTTGYIVGCQIDITGLEGGLSGSISASPSLSGSLSVPLKPGEAKFVALGGKSIKKGIAAIQYQRQSIGVEQCGGYAQAKAYTVVQTSGDYVIKSTLYGHPFSLN